MRSSSKLRRSPVMVAVASLLLVAACQGGAGPSGDTGVVRLALVPASADVAGIQYSVTCDDGTNWTQYVPLEDEGLPEHVSADHAGLPFADLYFVSGATECTIDAGPMSAPGVPSEDCEPASVDVTVVPDETTEVLLVISCTSPDSGGADVATLINHAPAVDKITVTPGTEVEPCKEVRISPVVSDADGDAVTLSFTLTPPDAGVVIDEVATDQDLTFTPATPGEWKVAIAADDPWATTEVVVDIKVLEGDAPCAQ